jgi:hypothetical protein
MFGISIVLVWSGRGGAEGRFSTVAILAVVVVFLL